MKLLNKRIERELKIIRTETFEELEDKVKEVVKKNCTVDYYMRKKNTIEIMTGVGLLHVYTLNKKIHKDLPDRVFRVKRIMGRGW